AYLAQSMTLYDAQRHSSQVFLYGVEPGVFGLSYTAWVLWQLGYPDQALRQSGAARTLGQELSYPFSLAAARIFAAILYQFRRDRPLTQEGAEAGMTLAGEQGFPSGGGEGLSCGAGRSPTRARGKRGLLRSAKAWPPAKPSGMEYIGPIILP